MCRALWRPLGLAVLLLLGACSSSSFDEKLDLGGDCAGQNDRCQTGLCLQADSATSVCTKSCTQASDCPAGMLCDVAGTLGRVCLPVGLGGRCHSDDQCPAGHRCDTDAQRCYIPVTRELCSPCTSGKQCPQGGACHEVAASGERYCTVPCQAGSCAAGFRCDQVGETGEKQCVPDNAQTTCSPARGLCAPCRGDNECGTGKDLCVRNLASSETFCGRTCQRASDCPTNFSCLDLSGEGKGPTQCVPNSGTCQGYCDSDDPQVVRRQCGMGASCDVAARRCQAATDGRLCASCQDDDGCTGSDPSTRCVVNNCSDCSSKGERFCATGCTGTGGGADPAKCPAGFSCTGLGAGGTSGPWQCVPVSGSCRGGAGQLGDDCTAKGAGSCLSGVCLGFGSQSVCSTACAQDGDCGDGRYRCCAVTGQGDTFDCAQPPGAQGGVCSPRGGAFGADCSPGQPPCHEGVCLDLGTARLCTQGCAQGSCPTGFSCRDGRKPKGDGSFETVQVCFPDGGGDTGADCTFGPAACRSGYCIKKESGNICTQLCGDAAACPDGYECRATTTVDQQSIQACIPPDLK